ncbi:FliA/WhiG family RNA polymerase sigma factor [Thermodesulfomicrobium sp. WS]|uniref:FliA/WhiG family RNA polymerase sigma factor n=1 Tax=Thermodesulfomicrobium sp. WS TaxID=3004129 RepID=UPI002491036D|nr:FliA/WhiG family RNA polymerase sigma factor [Thermodesulfomicrobium sp. WS]
MPAPKPRETLSAADKDRLARQLAPRIKAIALHFKARLPGHVDLQELISSGAVGLMEAMEKFTPERGIRFETFAEARIRGAMLDTLRGMDWYSRGLRGRIKKLQTIMLEYERSHGHAPSRQALQELCDIPEEDLECALEALNAQVVLSLEAIQETCGVPEDAVSPEAQVAHQELIDKVAGLVDKLTFKEKMVLGLYYIEELNMKEIAQVLDITEGRVSQLHSQATRKLRSWFCETYGNF